MEEFENLLPPLQAIKYKCYDCSGWNWAEVRNCDRVKCTLYPYRMGHHPKLKGKGGKGNPEALRLARERKTQNNGNVDKAEQ